MNSDDFLSLASSRSAKGLIEGLLGIVVIVIGIYLAFWVFGIILRIIVLVLVAGVVIYLFFMLVDWINKLSGS